MNTKTIPYNVRIIQCYATLQCYATFATAYAGFVLPYNYNNPMNTVARWTYYRTASRYVPEITVL